MTGYNHKITNGSLIRGEHLKLSRAKAIYKAATVHPYIKDVLCYVNGKGDAVIKMRLTHLEIPDEPIYEINAEEEIEYIILLRLAPKDAGVYTISTERYAIFLIFLYR